MYEICDKLAWRMELLGGKGEELDCSQGLSDWAGTMCIEPAFWFLYSRVVELLSFSVGRDVVLR